MTTGTKTNHDPSGSEGPESQMEAERQRKQGAICAARAMLETFGFDAIVCMASYVTEDGGTAVVAANAGNWYAQNGMMRHGLAMRDEAGRIEERRKDD